jgi:hypothetical protein
LKPALNLTSTVREIYRDIYVIVGPPRSSSTALARVFWESPAITHYCHEPFDRSYYDDLGYRSAIDTLASPLKLKPAGNSATAPRPTLLIKEMTFQVGANFPTLAALTDHPIIFIVRDPRLCISSRMHKLKESGRESIFPIRESGWSDLDKQIRFCDYAAVPYILLDSADLRSRPDEVLPLLFGRLGLSFSSQFLSWEPMANLALGALGSRQRSWYRRILGSRGIQPENTPTPNVDSFPSTGGFRKHVELCCKIYADLKRREQMLRVLCKSYPAIRSCRKS